MNNEIKEILDFKEDADYKRLSVDEITILRDYITNLQEENKRLGELCNKYEEEHKTTFKMWEKDLKNFEHEKNRELKSRIDKAIEYMKLIRCDKTDKYIPISDYDEYKKLLNILEGSDKE